MSDHGTTDAPAGREPTSLSPLANGAAPAPRAAFGAASTFRSLRHRNYRLYFFGQLISLTGSWMQATALMWVAYRVTKESRWPAWIMAVQILPTFFFGAWAGSLADHWPKRPLIFVCQGLMLMLAVVLGGLVLGGTIHPWALFAISAANGLAQAVDVPARLAFVMEMVGREDLINAVALNSLSFNVARALGPAVAGAALAWSAHVLGDVVVIAGCRLLWPGPGLCFLINGLSYVAVLVALARMDPVPVARPARRFGSLRSVLGGFAYLAGKPGLAVLVLAAGTTALFGWPFMTLLPALAERVLGAREQGYSLMVSGTGLGALTAAWTVATYGSLAHRRTFLAAGVALVSAGLIALSLAWTLFAAAASCAVIGFGLILFLATGQSVVQLGAGDDNRGRIMGIWAMVLSGAVPLGNVLAGPAADLWTVPLVLYLEGLGCATAAVVLLAVAGLWAGAGGRGDGGPACRRVGWAESSRPTNVG